MSIVTILRAGRFGVRVPAEASPLVFFKMSRPAMRDIQRPIRWVPKFVTRGTVVLACFCPLISI